MFELSKEIESVVGEAQNGFVCVLKNGYVARKTLPNDDPRVLEYFKQKLEKVSMPDISIADWVSMVRGGCALTDIIRMYIFGKFRNP